MKCVDCENKCSRTNISDVWGCRFPDKEAKDYFPLSTRNRAIAADIVSMLSGNSMLSYTADEMYQETVKMVKEEIDKFLDGETKKS